MWWNVGLVVLLLLVGATTVWLLAPTMRTFRGPGFEPTRADDASVFWAQQSGIIQGSGGL